LKHNRIRVADEVRTTATYLNGGGRSRTR